MRKMKNKQKYTNKYAVNKMRTIKNKQKYTNKYAVNKMRTMKNKQKYNNIYKPESVQKHYLNYNIKKLRLGERK